MIFNLALGVDQTFLSRREGVGHEFFYQPHFQMLRLTPYAFLPVPNSTVTCLQ